MSVVNTIKKIKAEIKKLRPVKFYTDGKLPFCSINDIRSEHQAIQMIAELKMRETVYNEAAELIGSELEYDDQFDYTADEYIDDIKLKLKSIKETSKRTKLEKMISNFDELKTREDKVEELEDQLKNILNS